MYFILKRDKMIEFILLARRIDFKQASVGN